ncbi:RHS repeat-associated core domain-containing protein [Montanilutibacter psychrotolerans]|uniref:Type IV secretion protein Rhs n=1 Tax=Montanilutibacter psychrotolerans TaxID=1327343 RepID=A0A3M8SWE1_9GAMM|nr:RHS repeat-associated core domain-containing protein [Lysobacter psychrotolerans]RNF85015.1 type IV secretion protein Rhs [Lysobacter psychrotolerans]
MTIAAKHFDPQLGIDIHLYLIPPSPIPIPLPTPHIGIVLDPFDYIPVIGGTVQVNGIKRATAGSMGLDIHIPVGGVWMPTMKMPMGPQWDDEIFMGSKTVLADGEPFSRVAMPVLACNIVGMVAPFRLKKPKKPHLSLLLPTTLNLAIPTNVFVGGPPTVSWTSLLFNAGLAGLGKVLKKTGIAGRAADTFKKVRQKLFKNMEPGFLKCKVLRAEPVDIRDGSVSVAHEDFSIPGRLPLAWTRRYGSNNAHAGVCGHGWQTPADIRLEIEPDGTVLFVDASSTAVFPQLPVGEGIEHAVREFVDGARLFREGDELWVRTKDGLRHGFVAGPANVAALQPQALPIERIEDLCGNHWRFERAHGSLVRIVESGIDDAGTGQVLQGRFLEVASRGGRIERLQLHDPATGLNHPLVSYRYSAEGDLVAALDALDAARTFEYQQHHLLRHTDRVGLSFYYAYNARWQVIHAWGDGGLHDYRFRYDSALNETEITDSLGHVSIVKFDDNGLPLCEIDPLDGVTVFEYDDVGRTTAVVDPMGLRSEFEYDERGNLLTLTRADGNTLCSTYDDDDRPLTVTDPGGAAWTQRWDARGLLIEQVTPLGAISHFDYDDNGLLRNHTDPLGASTRLQFDRHGHLQRLVDPAGAASTFTHDGLGCLQQRTTRDGQVARYHYDAKGRLLQVEQPSGRVRCDYDAEDQLTRHTDTFGAVTRLEFVGLGQVAKRVQPDGHCVRYEYDTEERLVAVTNQRGETHRLHRDPVGRVTEEVDYWNQARQYRYDAAGRLTGIVDPLGQATAYVTDPLGRITAKTLLHPDGGAKPFKEQFKYDRAGRLIELRNPHRHVTRTFDAAGQLVEENQDGFRVTSTYDILGRRVLRETSIGNRVACAYDRSGHLDRIALNDEAPIVIERDEMGRIVGERLGPQVRRQRKYDARGRLTAQSVSHGEAPLFETRYAYDRSGNLTGRNDSEHGDDHYAYDPLGRLLSHVDPTNRITHFLNDPAGDRLRTRVQELRLQRAVGADILPDQWTREGSHEGLHYVFDRSGNLVRRGESRSFDGPGDEVRDLHLRWDANNRLVESRKDGKCTGYGYDPLGRRVFKRNPTHTTWFFWDGNALLAEVTHANDAVKMPALGESNVLDLLAARKRKQAFEALHKRAREYVYYPGTFVPLAMLDKQEVRSTASQAGDPVMRHPNASRDASAPKKVPLVPLVAPHAAAVIQSAPAHAKAPTPAGTRASPMTGGGFGGLGAMTLGQPTAKEPATGSLALAQATEASGTAQPAAPSDSGPTSDVPAQAQSTGPVAALGGLGGLGMLASAGGTSGQSGPGLLAAAPVTSSEIIRSTVDTAVPANEDAFEAASVPVIARADLSEERQASVEWETVVYHYHVDPNGCPTRVTTMDGQVAWSMGFTAWGATRQQHVARIDNPLRFQGQYFDAESGLHYNRHRYYDSGIGQFVGQDPIRLLGGTNTYEYSRNAIAWADPLGLTSTPVDPPVEPVGSFGGTYAGGPERLPSIVYDGGRTTLFHYTSGENLQRILDSNELWRSTGFDHARYGDGQYLADIVPEDVVGVATKQDLNQQQLRDKKLSLGQLSSLFYNRGSNIDNLTHYIEIDVSDLEVRHGLTANGNNARRGIQFVLNDGNLDLTGRIRSHGPVGCRG